jgi:zinc D-Ala-D-Ala carboxypeptidase|tara:strand:+ start:870 stop:1328 length:459 start_codon:yes stop_codon:yes gene_type:complete
MRISKHISYREATHSATAKRRGLDNTPNQEQLENMYKVAEFIFEPLRLFVGGPIKINSFFRSGDVNKAVGGTSRSQHCKGQAIDIDDVFGHKTNAEMFQYVRENLDFDQMIWEFGSNNNPSWLHISYVSKAENRNRILRAVKRDGKTKYELF